MRDGKYVILCVDDDADIRDSLRVILEADGYVVFEAESAEEGLKSFKAEAPDLVIVDLMMEEVDAGTSLVKDLQALGNQSPVYMLSAVGDEFSAQLDPSSLGLSGVFQKPIEPATIRETVRTRLR